jgi:hypothetical protein
MKLEPEEISCKILVAFMRNYMFLKYSNVQHIHFLVCKKCVQKDPSKKNIIIQYTHDVLAFKEKHQLRLVSAGFLTTGPP